MPTAQHDARPGVQEALLLLETEDAEKFEGAMKILSAGIAIVAIALIAFDFALAAWNATFDTSYYAIFDTGTVLTISFGGIALLAFSYHKTVERIAKSIQSLRLSTPDLRSLRDEVGMRSWEGKNLIQAAVAMAIKNSVLKG